MHGNRLRSSSQPSLGSKSGTLVEHWNGSAWTIEKTPNPGKVSEDGFAAIAAASPSDVWAVGGFAASSSVNSTLVEAFCR